MGQGECACPHMLCTKFWDLERNGMATGKRYRRWSVCEAMNNCKVRE